MINQTETSVDSLGIEPMEIFGFSTQEELDFALIPLMQEINELTED